MSLKTIKYKEKTNFKELYSITRYLLSRNKIQNYATIIFSCFMAYVIITTFIDTHDLILIPFLLFFIALIFHAYTFGYLHTRYLLSKKLYKEDFEYEISDKGIKYSNSLVNNFVSWNMIKDYQNNKNYLLFDMSALGAISINKKNLTKKEIEDLVAFSEKNVKKTKVVNYL